MTNIQLFKRELQKRISNGTVTTDDLQILMTSARRTGSMSDRMLYAQASRALREQEEQLE